MLEVRVSETCGIRAGEARLRLAHPDRTVTSPRAFSLDHRGYLAGRPVRRFVIFYLYPIKPVPNQQEFAMPPARHTTKDLARASGLSIHRVSQLADRGILLSPGDIPAGGTGRRKKFTDASLRKAF